MPRPRHRRLFRLAGGAWSGDLAALAAAAPGFAALTLKGSERWQPLALAAALIAALIAAGVLAGALRAMSMAMPMLPYHYYGPVEGLLLRLDRSSSDHPPITTRSCPAVEVRPGRHAGAGAGDPDWRAPMDVEPGMQVMTTGFRGPQQAPAEPGGFDFQRFAWFDRLGAVGYTRVPLIVAGPMPGGPELFFNRLRKRIAEAARAQIPVDAGDFVAAILTNDKSELSQESLSYLRIANLAHMLAISGLHMALDTGFVCSLLRYGRALMPGLVLRWPTKKIAAGVALVAAAFYLMLSGAAVATERSFVMVSVMLVAVLFDRWAVTLRSVAISATIILILQPESLTETGFEMSYSAMVALIAVFQALTRAGRHWPVRRWAAPVLALVISSVTAGLATAPFGAAYFGRMSCYRLLANLLAMPVMR